MNSANSFVSSTEAFSVNNRSLYIDLDEKWSFSFSVILAAILSISAFLAVVGNSMVLTVVIRHRGMRTRTNLFLVNLAVADLLVGTMVQPFAITTLIEGKWIFGDDRGTFCTINGWLNCFCLVASIHTLMYISIHKHYSITNPLGNHFKLRQILGMMAAAWAWAAVSSTITVTGMSSVRYKPGTTQCGPEYPDGLKSYIFHAIIQVTNIFIPFIILTICYTRMFRAIRAHSKRLQQNSTLEQDIILAQQKKVAITLFIVLACFIVCALPFHLYATYTTIQKDKHFSPYLNPVAYSFLYLNSACNPIIYAFRSPSFREGYKEILCQTPTYVISDDKSDRLTPLHRMSSFFSLRQTNTSDTKNFQRLSDASQNSNCSNDSLAVTSPISTSPGPSGRRLKRQKSISGLIRATRNSKKSSIINQNGDVIIVKAGKIVSIRRQASLANGGLREQDGKIVGIRRQVPDGPRDQNQSDNVATMTPPASLDLTTTPDTKESVGVTNGYTNHENVPVDNNNYPEDFSKGNRRKSSTSSVGVDSVFSDSLSPPHKVSEGVSGSPFQMVSPDKRLLSVTDDVKEESDDKAFSLHAGEERFQPEVEPFQAKEKPCTKITMQTKIGIIINIDEDDSILDIVPLTPRTRDRITRSEEFLNDLKDDLPIQTSCRHVSRSTQGLNRRLHRLPSVEFLDPPISLRRSTNDLNRSNASLSNAPLSNVRPKYEALFALRLPPPSNKRWSLFGREKK